MRWCAFYGTGCAIVGFTANGPWLFGRWVTVALWVSAAAMFYVVGFRPGFKRRRTLVILLATAGAVRAFGSAYPELSLSNFLLRATASIM